MFTRSERPRPPISPPIGARALGRDFRQAVAQAQSGVSCDWILGARGFEIRAARHVDPKDRASAEALRLLSRPGRGGRLAGICELAKF